MRCLTIELRDREIEEFIRRKRLSPEDRNDPGALRRTVHQYLDDTLVVTRNAPKGVET